MYKQHEQKKNTSKDKHYKVNNIKTFHHSCLLDTAHFTKVS